MFTGKEPPGLSVAHSPGGHRDAGSVSSCPGVREASPGWVLVTAAGRQVSHPGSGATELSISACVLVDRRKLPGLQGGWFAVAAVSPAQFQGAWAADEDA